jgi:hypothetical protein
MISRYNSFDRGYKADLNSWSVERHCLKQLGIHVTIGPKLKCVAFNFDKAYVVPGASTQPTGP